VLLIEAERVGWAASGRNGGFVEASITHGDEDGRSRWPDEIRPLEQLGLANLDGMQADIEKYGMDAGGSAPAC
jgi:glycine/D-amino acid oxidase-like deaminating enzyme